MKFAVLEYTSKSGNIWRHHDGHPNYLANPITELDPTSFGCYVSVFQGEHIPLKGLIVGPVENVSKPSVIYRKVVKRIAGSWPSYSLKYLQQFDALLVVHQLSDAHELVSAIEKIKKMTPRPKIIGVPTQPFGILKDAFAKNVQSEQEFIRFMNACDIFLSIVKETTNWYQQKTETKVVYMPQPYPVEFASQLFKPLEQKDKVIMVAGVTQRDNIKKGQLVAKELQKLFPNYLIRLPKVKDFEYDFSNLDGAKYEVLPFEEWHDHLKTISKTMLVINTDYTFTRGRVQTDCAAVGTLTIGANSDAQRDLYPEFIGEANDSIEKIVAQGKQLLTNTDLYKKTAEYATRTLLNYNYANSKKRMEEIL